MEINEAIDLCGKRLQVLGTMLEFVKEDYDLSSGGFTTIEGLITMTMDRYFNRENINKTRKMEKVLREQIRIWRPLAYEHMKKRSVIESRAGRHKAAVKKLMAP